MYFPNKFAETSNLLQTWSKRGAPYPGLTDLTLGVSAFPTDSPNLVTPWTGLGTVIGMNAPEAPPVEVKVWSYGQGAANPFG